MGDFVKHGKTDLRAQFFQIGKTFAQRLGEDRDLIRKQRRVESRSLRQWHALINPEQSIAPRIEPLGEKQSRGRSFFDHEFDVAQLLAELMRQAVDYPRNLFSDFTVVQWSGFSRKR